MLCAKSGRFSEACSHVTEATERGEVPSMVIAVADSGEIVLEEAFGWADQESEIEATPHTVYPTASLSPNRLQLQG